MDVPLINRKFGFGNLPMGCNTWDRELAPSHEPVQDLTIGVPFGFEEADLQLLQNQSWYDGDECHDSILNNNEQGVDCGGSCNLACEPCQCDWTRSGPPPCMATLATCTNPNDDSGSWDEMTCALNSTGDGCVADEDYCVYTPAASCTQTGDLSVYGSHQGCWDDDLLDRIPFRCFVVNATACDLLEGGPSGYATSSTIGAEWLAVNDGLKYCNDAEVALWISGDLFYTEPTCTPEPEADTRVWYCNTVQTSENLIAINPDLPDESVHCFECNVSSNEMWGPGDSVKSRCARGCKKVDFLATELPLISKLVWGITIASLLSALSDFGELGGTYMLMIRLVTYVNVLNIVQGALLLFFCQSLAWSHPGAVALGTKTMWQWTASLSVLQIVQGICGLVGIKLAHSNRLGWIFLQSSMLMALVILVTMVGGLAIASYLAMNVEKLSSRYWDSHIEPELTATTSQFPDFITLSNISRHEFVELARGSFRCVIMLALWTALYLSVLVFGTRYIIMNRHSDGAEWMRDRTETEGSLANAVSNPMWQGDKNEIASPLRGNSVDDEADD